MPHVGRPGEDHGATRPQYHAHVGIHGDLSPHADSVHLHTRDAHLKEWPGLLVYARNRTTARRSNASFVIEPGDVDEISDPERVRAVRIAPAHINENGSATTLHYDSVLRGWFEAVAARLKPASGGATNQFARARLVILAVVVGILC